MFLFALQLTQKIAVMANIVAVLLLPPLPITTKFNAFTFSHKTKSQRQKLYLNFSKTNHRMIQFPSSLASPLRKNGSCFLLECLPSAFESSNSSSNHRPSSTKLYVCGLSFRTTEESLRNAFENFGQLVEVNLVMDKIANRPRGFAFLHYATEEESRKAIEGMHGKFLDGRVIFVEVAKPRSQLRQRLNQNTK